MKKEIFVIFKDSNVCSMHINDLAAERALKSFGEGFNLETREIEIDEEMNSDLLEFDSLFFNINISREDILDLTKFGFRVAHKHFDENEWVRWDSNKGHFVTEDGINMGTEESEFWTIRSGDSWEKGWRIWYEK